MQSCDLFQKGEGSGGCQGQQQFVVDKHRQEPHNFIRQGSTRHNISSVQLLLTALTNFVISNISCSEGGANKQEKRASTMESSPSFQSPQPQGTPLIPISPERINQQRSTPSPSKSTEQSHHQSPSKGPAGVQSKVAFLNGLAHNNSPSPGPVFQSSTTSAALQRAILGREEAETALEGAASQLSEARARERKISERVESLLEELQAVKKSQSHERAVFEKEVRKARKEAFRAGSNVVKAQDELKSSRSEIKGLKDELNEEREAKDQAKQEALENEYKLAGVTEELTALKEQFRSLEAKSHTDELEVKAEEICDETPEARPVLGELKGNVPEPITPAAKTGRKEKRTPSTRSIIRSMRRRRADSPNLRLLHPLDVELTDDYEYKENMDPENIDPGYVEDLRIDFKLERKERLRAEDTIKLMKMQCQFLACACRCAERRGERYIFDFEYDRKLQEQERQRKQKEECEGNQEGNASGPQAQEDKDSSQQPGEEDVPMKDTETNETQQEESLITFSPNRGTFHSVASPAKENPHRSESREPRRGVTVHTGDSIYEEPSTSQPDPPPQASPPELTMEDAHPSQPFEHSTSHIQSQSPFVSKPPNLANPKTPSRPSSKNANIPIQREQATSNDNNNPRHNNSAITETVTTTTTVPLHSENREKSSDPYATIPGTPVTRQEALAQIKARRGRARSNTNRSASANEVNSRPPSRPPSRARAVTPVRKGRQTPTTTGQGDRNRVRKVTNSKDRRHISAPGRC